MNKIILGAVAALALSSAAVSAQAATFLYVFTSNDGTESAFGTLQANLVAPGEYEAVSGTITAGGVPETGDGVLIPNQDPPNTSLSPLGFFLFDNQVLPGQNPLVTNPGLLFKINADEVNIFSNGGSNAVPHGTYSFFVNNTSNTLGALAITAVPEPASWAMMIVGFFGLGSLLRARRPRALVRA